MGGCPFWWGSSVKVFVGLSVQAEGEKRFAEGEAMEKEFYCCNSGMRIGAVMLHG